MLSKVRSGRVGLDQFIVGSSEPQSVLRHDLLNVGLDPSHELEVRSVMCLHVDGRAAKQ